MAEGGQSAGSGKEEAAKAVQSQQQLESKECVEAHTVESPDDAVDLKPRRSQRARKLTEKGKELHEQRVTRLVNRFNGSYFKYKALANTARRKLKGRVSKDILQGIIYAIESASEELDVAYEELRQKVNPDNDIRRRVDTCGAVTRVILEAARSRLDEDVESYDPLGPCTDTGSLFPSVASQDSKLSYASSRTSSKPSTNLSKRSSLAFKKQEAAAEIAAAEATLVIQQQQDKELEELQRLEAEKERKKRDLERLETLKTLSAAKARMQVYEQEDDLKDDTKELLRDFKPEKSKHVPSMSNPQENTQTSHQEGNMTDLIRVLAESISSSRLPIPEPAMFYGDPIKFSDWKLSFQTLIDRKNIPVNEKLYYLRKYVKGPAKNALEGYFLIGTDSAYHAAWDILQERYGDPIVIAKAFRDKLNSWSKIGSKDSVELREFADFLKGCEAAMSQIKSLEVLNDCNENQKILAKLPDWLTSRWNRQVLKIKEETKTFPSFSQFVTFLTKEAKLACNPVTSLHALKPTETVRAVKADMLRNFQRKRAEVLVRPPFF